MWLTVDLVDVSLDFRLGEKLIIDVSLCIHVLHLLLGQSDGQEGARQHQSKIYFVYITCFSYTLTHLSFPKLQLFPMNVKKQVERLHSTAVTKHLFAILNNHSINFWFATPQGSQINAVLLQAATPITF